MKMLSKEFIRKHPSFEGRLRELIDNPFSIIGELTIDKDRVSEVIEKYKCGYCERIEELKKELGID